MWSRKRLLIWGTTYPEFSKSYYETVCTGAIEGETGGLVRLYPIALRHMQEPFRLYQWIDAEIERNESDFRPESYRIRQDTIIPREHVGTRGDGWRERSRWVLRKHNVFPSVEALQDVEIQDHTSLGLVKPKRVSRIYVKRKSQAEREEWETQRDLALRQRDLFVDAEAKTKDLKFMPVQYRMCFSCDDPACNGEHDLAVLDWGTYVLSRKEYARGGPSFAEQQVISRLRRITDPATTDAYVFLGNTKAHSNKFSVAGFFYPPTDIQARPKPQGTLELPGIS